MQPAEYALLDSAPTAAPWGADSLAQSSAGRGGDRDVWVQDGEQQGPRPKRYIACVSPITTGSVAARSRT
jgi:hypothetical protein